MRLTRLVERDVSVLANPAEEELDAAVLLDLGLVTLALFDQVLRVPVQDVDLRGRDVDLVRSLASDPKHTRAQESVAAPCEKNSRNMKVW